MASIQVQERDGGKFYYIVARDPEKGRKVYYYVVGCAGQRADGLGDGQQGLAKYRRKLFGHQHFVPETCQHPAHPG